MPWWVWILVVACGICLGAMLFILAWYLLVQIIENGRAWWYNYSARKTNARARKFRLERNDWEGYPLPQGKTGTILITEEMQIQHAVTYRMLENQYQLRAKDLNVLLVMEKNPMNRHIRVQWFPNTAKNRKYYLSKKEKN